MTPYILLFIFVSSCLAISGVLGINYAFYLAGAMLIAFSSIRLNVGKDFENYDISFKEIIQTGDGLSFEPLNIILIKVVVFFGGNVHAIFFAYALITLFSVFFFIKKASPSKEISAFAFMCIGMFYFATFNQIRQWMAIAMMLFAIIYLAEKKNYTAYLFAIAGMFFHLSAMILIIIPALTKRYSLLFFLALLLSAGVIGKIALLGIQNTYYFRYIDVLRSDANGSVFLIAGYVFLLGASVFFSGYFNSAKELSRMDIILLNLCLVSLFILLCGFLAGLDFAYVMRVNMYFTIQLLALIPILIRSLSRPFQYLAYPVAVISLSYIYFSTLYLKGGIYHLTPFKTWIS